MVMIRRKTKKGSVGKTRPTLDYKAIGQGKNKPKKKTTTTVKSNRPTDGKTKTLRSLLKEKQKIANKIGTKGTRPNQAFLGGSASQIPKSKPNKPKRVIDTQKRSSSRKTNKKLGPYRSGNVLQNIVDSNKKAFPKKYMSDPNPVKKKKGGKAKLMAGGKASKYRAAGGGKMPMVMKDGKKIPAFAADGKGKMKAGGKTTKYMAKGGKTTKYMARGGKTSKYMSKGGRAK